MTHTPGQVARSAGGESILYSIETSVTFFNHFKFLSKFNNSNMLMTSKWFISESRALGLNFMYIIQNLNCARGHVRRWA